MTTTDTSPVSVASYFVNMYFVGCLPFPSGSLGDFCLRSEQTPGKTFIGKPLNDLP